ncbi:MAG: ABC transporter ATP-binding protein [Coleofasciculaceae cyanobacterium RL_1_1]|nr:ABC transporter ATP-binding protein [Coleofasciculaceae cyanobacterium RL_1_1]
MLSLERLGYHPAATEHPILSEINLKIPPTSLTAIIGPSGSGKTTLLDILAGLAEPTSGRVAWRSQELLPEQLHQLVGLVFQFPERHFCGMTILEELRLGHPELRTEQVFAALQEVGLGDVSIERAPHELSGGQQRRLALAVQLIRQPQILMLDEPTAGLDWSMRRQLVALLAKLKQEWSLLVVTHDAADLLEVADHCWAIEAGRLRSVDVASLR